MERPFIPSKPAAAPSMSSVHMNAIRGAAALLVLLGHTRGLFFSSLTGPQTNGDEHILIGDGAVMVFFVLSGYLVGGGVIQSLRLGTWSWKSYLIKRLSRLWLVLIPALLLGIALDHTGLHLFPSPSAIYAGPAGQQEVHDVAARMSDTTVAGNAVFLQTILVDTAGTNNSLWSLANEFWYYLVFPMVLLGFRKRQKLPLRCLYLLAVVCAAVFVGKTISLLFFIWLLGAILATLPLRIPQRIAKALSVLFILLVPAALITVKRSQLPKYVAEWIVAIVFSAAFYFLLHQAERPRRTLYPAIAGFFSRISYTLYLVHLPLTVFLCACFDTPWHRWPKSPHYLAAYALLNAALVLVSYLFYCLFEAHTQKVRGLLLSRLAPRRD